MAKVYVYVCLLFFYLKTNVWVVIELYEVYTFE